MRYDTFLRKLDEARAKYEATIQALILSVRKQDAAVDGTIRQLVKEKVVKTRKPGPSRKKQFKKGTHWTQRPENAEKLRRQLEKAWKTRQAQTLTGPVAGMISDDEDIILDDSKPDDKA